MKIVQINITCGEGSTGKICLEVSKLLSQYGVENYIFYSSGYSDYSCAIKYTSDLYIKGQALISRLNGRYGFNSNIATKRLISYLEKIQPEVVHLHNLHGHGCNIETLFKYLKKKKIRIFWTFHDCWAFTAYCPHFTLEKCDKWKNGCFSCPQRRQFSWFMDRSCELYQKKRAALSGAEMTVITPSEWLKNIVKSSFMRNYPIKVINNGIDINIFKPTPSDFRDKYDCTAKFLVLGVADKWLMRKGPDVFIELARRLDLDRYQIVMVGTDDAVDKLLPDSIASIHHTRNQKELAEIYTAADVFINPTREEVFGLVNIEALACGTPGITFRTGGSSECYDESCGVVVPCDDIDAMEREIIRICEEQPYSETLCINYAAKFDKTKKFKEYVDLYRKA